MSELTEGGVCVCVHAGVILVHGGLHWLELWLRFEELLHMVS